MRCPTDCNSINGIPGLETRPIASNLSSKPNPSQPPSSSPNKIAYTRSRTGDSWLRSKPLDTCSRHSVHLSMPSTWLHLSISSITFSTAH
ncbi:hypothetical protein G6F68_021007 [Rhizopus microsporus]|nr:hypothetical protein G6F68_021007 [Rhizopus microsporus]